jgi:hypothetical protein
LETPFSILFFIINACQTKYNLFTCLASNWVCLSGSQFLNSGTSRSYSITLSLQRTLTEISGQRTMCGSLQNPLYHKNEKKQEPCNARAREPNKELCSLPKSQIRKLVQEKNQTIPRGTQLIYMAAK